MEINKLLEGWGYENPVLKGTGAFGRVYRVRDGVTQRNYACKVSCDIEMLRKESLILRQLDHPLFPAFHEWREGNGMVFLFMEYVYGTTLKALIERRGSMSERQAISIGKALAGGLCYLHEQNVPVIFRDVKPDNILIKEDGAVKLVDLGSAAWDKASRAVLTGTEGFAAPEQWQNIRNVGSCSDVYALGKVLYFILGKREMSKGLSKLLEDCVNVDIGKRVQNMRCFLHRLRVDDCNYDIQYSVMKI